MLTAELTWRCRRNHTVELLPSIERLLAQAGASRDEVSAVFVCTGPGLYTGLRVGISVAKGLARALGIPLLGVPRLELDAYPHAAFPGRIVAVHRAGRGELAWAAYQGNPWREVSAPRLSKPEALASEIAGATIVVGEIDEALATLLAGRAVIASPAASMRHAAALAALGRARLLAGEVAEAALVHPLYLRPPVIGPR